MAATLVETLPAPTHYCLFCDVDAVIRVYSTGQEVIACPSCNDYKGILSTGDDEVFDVDLDIEDDTL
jgi:hypothetical protein